LYSDSSGKRRISLILAVLAGLALLGAVQWLRTRHTSFPTTARLVVVGGEAVVSRADAGIDPSLRTGASTTMQRGDEVRTGAGSRARLTFSGGEVVELGSHTRVAILELHETPMSRGLVVFLALEEGHAATRIRHMLFQGSHFVIETRVATMEAGVGSNAGTLFECQVIDKERIRVAVHEGGVTVSMGEQELQLNAGQGVVAQLGQPLMSSVVPTLVPSSDVPLASEATTETPSATKMPTLTNLQKTLFPPVITPTRPGDAVAPPVVGGGLDDGTYTVQPGDTLYSIARSQGVSWEALWQANKDILASPELIHPGQTLRMPTP
jgi:LysM repeat protein